MSRSSGIFQQTYYRRTSRLLSVRSGAGEQAFSFNRYEGLSNRHCERIVNSGSSWASSKLMYLAARAKRASNFKTGFLARDLKKSPYKRPREKALVFTSCVAETVIVLLVYNEETDLRLPELLAASELVRENGFELLEAFYYPRGQLVKPLLPEPSEGSDKNSTFDAVCIPVQQGCILETRKVFLGGACSPSQRRLRGRLAALLLGLLLSGVAHPGGPFEGTLIESTTVEKLPMEQGPRSSDAFFKGGFLPFLLKGRLLPAQGLSEQGLVSPSTPKRPLQLLVGCGIRGGSSPWRVDQRFRHFGAALELKRMGWTLLPVLGRLLLQPQRLIV
ncbi:UNVERIFIED_CONTAM: hypothetical protein Sindi_0858800, partial [Sesamum indicum]